MAISIFIFLVSLICVIVGLFSKTPNIEMHLTFSAKKAKLCSKIQLIFNCVCCFVLLMCCIRSFFDKSEFQTALVFIFQFSVNFVYTFVISFLTHNIRKKMLINTMNIFLKNERKFANDDELIKAFCKEYRDIDSKEAKRTLKNIRK